ncbi:HAMP domain-containing sensor histidine kinase [Actinomadura sp. KC345]|uniref:sensor histidine kinase n=1 Tax=Actinomadura sp. KC345 TaxID=2530371 RepID=UPI001043B622|nr:ATP-binding protein [Actinomadura sp. KC345]TDC54489.1 HAMP domain-containing sensor histidine kinase [Actinomadura sp. KC345]
MTPGRTAPDEPPATGSPAGDAAGGGAAPPPAKEPAPKLRITGPAVVLPEVDVPEAHGMSRLRLVQIYRLGSVVLGLLLLLAFVQAGSALYQNERAREHLINKVDPAALEQFRLSSAVTTQDAAIRDYAQDGGAARLAEYRAAVRQEAASAARMRGLLSGVPGHETVFRSLDKALDDSKAWRTAYADRVAAGPGAQGLDPEQSRRARQLLNQVRGDMTPLQAGITALHEQTAGELRSRADTAMWSTIVALTLVVVAALALAVLFRRTVLTPASLLTGRVRAVAQGDFGHPLDVPGPAEFAELSVIIDAMRNRIIDEWRVSVESTRQLDEQTEELRRSNAELEQFAYVASHDLQEPLRKVASFCQMIERRYGDQLDERGQQYIAFAVDGAKRMQALINDLLSFSRVGRMSALEESLDLNEVAQHALDNVAALREETGAEVEIGELPHVPGDRAQLTRLFQNLVGNAIKFRREGVPPRVTIDARRSGDEWEFRCADNGIGIEPRYSDRIFLIFQRLHPRDEYTGTGIGLALCKKIVEFHGGRIWLDPDGHGDDPGTVFHWTLSTRPPAHADSGGAGHNGQ